MKSCLEGKMGKYLTSAKGGWKGYKLIYGGDENSEQVVTTGYINKEQTSCIAISDNINSII